MKVVIPEAVMLPLYSNAQGISYGPAGFTLDFAQSVPGVPEETVVVKARIVMVPPLGFKEFVKQCNEHLAKFEAEYGLIANNTKPTNVVFDATGAKS